MKKIAVIGMGYVGLPLALEFGKTRDVVGFDINKKRIEELRNGQDTTLECDRDRLINAKKIRFSCEESDLEKCQIFIVTVPTPIDAMKRPDLLPLINASKLISKYLKKNDLVIYESTVYPGATEEVCVPYLEEGSKLRYNIDFYCGYSPERINPGDKINTLTTIKKITSGSTEGAAEEVDKLYKSIITAGTWKASSIRVAEAAKVIENSQRDLNIAFVNELSLIFQKLEIDTIEVLEAAGTKWNFLPFRPGLVGGHCIGVDPYYLTHKAEQVGYIPEVILAGRRINDNMAKISAQRIIQAMIANKINIVNSVVGIYGITFKDNCPDIRNSKVVDLIREFGEWGIKTLIVDPWANPEEVKREYNIELTKIEDLKCIDSIVVAVGHNEFKDLDLVQLMKKCKVKQPILADLKSIYNRKEAELAGFNVLKL